MYTVYEYTRFFVNTKWKCCGFKPNSQSILAVRKWSLDNIDIYFAPSRMQHSPGLFHREALAHFSFKGRWHLKKKKNNNKKTKRFNTGKNLNLQNRLCRCSSQTPPWSAGKTKSKIILLSVLRTRFPAKVTAFFSFAPPMKSVFSAVLCERRILFCLPRGGKLMI